MSKFKLIAEQIKKIRPLIKEASPQQKLKLMKLMKVALKEGFDERQVLIHKLASKGQYDVSDLELATDEELQQLLADEGEVNEVTNQSAIRQYQDVQNYKVKPSPKQDDKEFVKITVNRPKKTGMNESSDFLDEK
jgi:hypothetical protein